MGKRDTNDDLLASINHRLGLLDTAAHRIALIEQVNYRMTELDGRLRNAADSAETIGQLVRNLDRSLVLIAARLESIEARLITLENATK